MSGGGWAWEGGEGEVRAKPPPQLLTEPEIPAEQRRARQGKRDTQRQRATHNQNRRGSCIPLGMEPPYTQWAGGSNSISGAVFAFFCAWPHNKLLSLQPSVLTNLHLFPTEFEEGLLDRCPAPGPHPALVEGRRSSVKVEAEASRQ